MQKLIKNNAVIDDNFQVLARDAEASAIQEYTIVPLELFLNNSETVLKLEHAGVWLDSDQGPEPLASLTDQLKLIAINFPTFVDGRGYSYARVLRERIGYKGELRAIGDVLHDQLFFMKRCGFDAYAIREDKDAQAALEGLTPFTESYQAAVDQPSPLFRRRA